ncbi:MAG: DUF1501 domain-containing protein [Planctomycetota bacterium]|nr:DUF1501 domain-containing protein [Planctomycetota bacterium]
MLTLQGERLPFCDGVSRRAFIKVGFLGLGGLTLPRLLEARSEAAKRGSRSRSTSVIYLELAGGPSQFETYDPKPDAPREVRGPFGVVPTRLPGVYFSELMAEQARVADKLAVVRSIHHDRSSHDPSSHLSQTGYYKSGPKGGVNQAPCIGSVAAKLRGPNAAGLPAYVAVPRRMRNGGAAYLGNAFEPFSTGGDPKQADFRVRNLGLPSGLDDRRLDDRRTLLSALDDVRRLVDSRGVAEAMDRFTWQAFELVSGERAREAFDLAREPDHVRDGYGRNTVGQSMLLARRLVESGVTFVSVRVTGWDDHQNIEQRMRDKGPAYDRGVAALVRDIHERGLDRDVLVVAMGEFGRTPRINRNAGRDHWGALMSVLLAGGGLRVGQVIGASDRNGAVPADAPYRPENILAVAYRHLGIDPERTLPDFSGRPRYLLEERRLIAELI